MPVAIQMRMKQHAFLGYFADRVQAEDLKSAGIREDRAGPRHEPVKTAHTLDALMSRS